MTSKQQVDPIAQYNPYGIQQGVYPYPEECVFNLTAVRYRKTLLGTIKVLDRRSQPCAARRPEVALKVCAQSLPQDQQWAVESCISLADLRKKQSEALKCTSILPETEQDKSLSIDGEQVWIIEVPGKPYASVRCHSAKRVIQYLKETEQETATFIPLSTLNDLVAQLECVRDGKDPNEQYALDTDGTELTVKRRNELKTYNSERLAQYRGFTKLMNYEHLIDWNAVTQ